MAESNYRVTRRLLLGDGLVLVLLALDLAFGLWILPRLPQRVPMHWNLAGQPDWFAPPWLGAFLFPVLAVGVYLLLLYLPLLDPRRSNYPLFAGAHRWLRHLLPLFLVALHLLTALGALGYPVDPARLMRLLVPLLLIAMGAVLGQIRPNAWIGFRLSWTLADPELWGLTHRFAGRLWVAGGLVLLAVALALPAALWGAALLGLLALIILVPVALSYALYRRKGN